MKSEWGLAQLGMNNEGKTNLLSLKLENVAKSTTNLCLDFMCQMYVLKGMHLLINVGHFIPTYVNLRLDYEMTGILNVGYLKFSYLAKKKKQL